MRYYVQVDGEANPRGPLPASAVQRLTEAGKIRYTVEVPDGQYWSVNTDWLHAAEREPKP